MADDIDVMLSGRRGPDGCLPPLGGDRRNGDRLAQLRTERLTTFCAEGQ
jgi:hypothetical protein